MADVEVLSLSQAAHGPAGPRIVSPQTGAVSWAAGNRRLGRFRHITPGSQASRGKRMLMVTAATNHADPTCFGNSAVLVTRPGEVPALQWIVDTRLHGPELTAFHQRQLGGLGALIEHGPARGAPRGFTEVRIAVTDAPGDVIEQLSRRLRAAITTTPDGTG